MEYTLENRFYAFPPGVRLDGGKGDCSSVESFMQFANDPDFGSLMGANPIHK